MIEHDFLFTIAEISVGLAGFSAIVGFLGGRKGRADLRTDALRLQVMLEMSLQVAGAALVPVLVSHFGFETWVTWRISAAIWLLVAIPAEIIAWRRTSHIPQMKLNQLNVNTVNWILCLVSDVVMLVVAIGQFGPNAGALYLLAIFLYLASAAVLFVQFASSTFIPDGN
jgi:hypothetical protein